MKLSSKKIGEPQVYLDMLTERPSLLVTRRILSFILIYSRRTLTLSFRHGAVCRWQPWRCKALSQSGDGVLLKPRLATWSLGAPPGLVPCVRGFGREPSSLAFAWWFLSDNRIRGLFQSDLEVRRICSLLERLSLSGQPTWCRQETGTHLHTKFPVRAFHEQQVEIKPVCGSEIVADSGTKHVSTRVLETCLEQLGVRITQLDAKAQTIDMVRVGSWVDDVVMVAMFRGWVVASADPEGCDVCNGDVLRLGFFASKGTEVQNVADRVRRTLVWPRWVLGACYAQCTKLAWIWFEMQGRMLTECMILVALLWSDRSQHWFTRHLDTQLSLSSECVCRVFVVNTHHNLCILRCMCLVMEQTISVIAVTAMVRKVCGWTPERHTHICTCPWVRANHACLSTPSETIDTSLRQNYFEKY